MKKPAVPLPAPMKKALADLARFGALSKFATGWAPSPLHMPELAHDDRAITACVSAGFAARADGLATPTPAGLKAWADIEAAREVA